MNMYIWSNSFKEENLVDYTSGFPLIKVLKWIEENEIDPSTVIVKNSSCADVTVTGEKGERFRYRFPVGDWSGDGHDKCEYFIVEGSKEMGEVANAHQRCNELHGFEIGKICHEYEDNELHEWEIEAIRKMGIDPSDFVDESKQHELDDGSNWRCNEIFHMDPQSVAKLWVAILNKIDPELRLIIIEDKVPEMNNCTVGVTDEAYEKNPEKSFDNPGYGCFY